MKGILQTTKNVDLYQHSVIRKRLIKKQLARNSPHNSTCTQKSSVRPESRKKIGWNNFVN